MEAHVCEDLVDVAAVAHRLVALHLIADRFALHTMRRLVVDHCTRTTEKRRISSAERKE